MHPKSSSSCETSPVPAQSQSPAPPHQDSRTPCRVSPQVKRVFEIGKEASLGKLTFNIPKPKRIPLHTGRNKLGNYLKSYKIYLFIYFCNERELQELPMRITGNQSPSSILTLLPALITALLAGHRFPITDILCLIFQTHSRPQGALYLGLRWFLFQLPGGLFSILKASPRNCHSELPATTPMTMGYSQSSFSLLLSSHRR